MSIVCGAAIVLVCVLQVHGKLVLDAERATQVLHRRTRANGFLEELRGGDMERECQEEVCDWEEAREIFQNQERTDEFWSIYYDGDACQSTPCANGGTCKDGVGSYTCWCRVGYEGPDCRRNARLPCDYNNGGCEHFCDEEDTPICSCADGYFLTSDNETCQSTEVFKCGTMMVSMSVLRNDHRNTMDTSTADTDDTEARGVNADSSTPVSNGNVSQSQEQERVTSATAGGTRVMDDYRCPPGECPWQALLMNEDDDMFCGGTVLSRDLILTAAHCLNQSRHVYVVVGAFNRSMVHGNEAVHAVESAVVHQHYKADVHLNNIAVLKLATPIQFSQYILPACLPTRNLAEKVLVNRFGLVSGFGGLCRQTSPVLRRLAVPYVDWTTCRTSGVLVSSREFCGGYGFQVDDDCFSDDGGPHVTRYHDTYFITGIGNYHHGNYHVYTKVSRYLRWIHAVMEMMTPKKTSTIDPHDHHRGPMTPPSTYKTTTVDP